MSSLDKTGTESAKDGNGKDSPEQLKHSLEFQSRLNDLMQAIHGARNFSDIMPEIEPSLLILLGAERITVYQRSRHDQAIVSKFKSGDEIEEIRQPLTATSIAGFVALNSQELRIADVYDTNELKKIHPHLKFDQSMDKKSGFSTHSMIVVPIMHNDIMLGVMQLINHRNGGKFTDIDQRNASKFASILAQKFRYDIGGTDGPYDYLVHTKKITANELASFSDRCRLERTTISQLLLSETNLTSTEIGESLERYYQVPYSPYDASIEIPSILFSGLSESFLRKQLWVPIAGDSNEVTILIDDPTDTSRIMDIQRVLPANNYVFKVGLPNDILRYLGLDAGNAKNVELGNLVGQLENEVTDEDFSDTNDQVDENAATVIQLVNQLIVEAYNARASDIHIEPGRDRQPASVRFRIDGVCQRSLNIPSSHISAVVSRIKIMARLDIAERRKPQDGKLVIRHQGQPLELRVATLPTVNGESIVMRILAASKALPLNKLNLSSYNEKIIKELISKPHGIFLVVGPTGSGKTTTLHALLGHINTPEKKIWTAEDPVEITQPGLQQLQIAPKIDLTFASALRSFLRADPDVIMIGEMRDNETAEIGVEASLTGHLVFSTLHTNSASETVARLLDLGVDPINFSDALLGVLAQRLVRTLCNECKEAYEPDEQELKLIKRYYGEKQFDELESNKQPFRLYRAKGCKACGNTGYYGRTGIYELLTVSQQMTDLIYKKATATEMKTLAIHEGMRTLMQDGITKLLEGQTDLDQIRRVTSD